ncbi:UbiX family flavin prenyltransferase [Comamonas nitrativorans]|uniref:Flavin prenyltransferase UbiX n=1 Tax=Comamonas nitrativorans TaxID=108437 RepID=A0ABV9GRM2_9BURK
MPEPRQRIIVGISGASGAIYGVRLLQALRQQPQIETHAIISDAGWLNITHELGLERAQASAHIDALADVVHGIDSIGASIASGSFRAVGMVVAPCSMRTLAAIAHGLADNLLTRAADVMLKERRRLILLARETPLHLVHLRNMTTVTEMGAIVCPPVPAFYQKPQTVEDIVQHSIARVLDLLGLEQQLAPPWAGL